VKGFLWYYWDPLRLTLYYITKAEKSSKDEAICMLHRILVGDKGPRPPVLTLPLRIPENHVNWPVCSAWAMSSSPAAMAMHITPVQMGDVCINILKE